MDDALTARFAFGTRLVAEAGDLALSYFRRLDTLTIKAKGRQDMASEADVDTEVLIRDRLRAAFPEDGFVGEETGSSLPEAEGLWVVDPIDGTQPFVSGIASWCVSIAYVHRGRLEMGFVNAPALGESFAARRGHGARLNGAPIRVADADRIDNGLLAVGYSSRMGAEITTPIFARALARGAAVYRNGSGALMLCYVACGRLIGYVEPSINAWDCLGALAVLGEAGGEMSDFIGEGGLAGPVRLVAGPPAIMPALREVLG